jgi:hypothetical protein
VTHDPDADQDAQAPADRSGIDHRPVTPVLSSRRTRRRQGEGEWPPRSACVADPSVLVEDSQDRPVHVIHDGTIWVGGNTNTLFHGAALAD